jgi:hypothetical protein
LNVNLDLSYITPRIIATSYPAQGLEGFWRNSLTELARFLNTKHPEKYLVLNLSERPYDIAALENRVVEFGFPDHHSPPVEVAWRCCLTMHSWLAADPENVVVVHCLAGKGRTGVVIACYLLFCGVLLEREQGGAHAPNPFSPPRSSAGGNSSIHGRAPAPEFFVLPPPASLASRALGVFARARGEGVKYESQKRIVVYFAKVIHATLLQEHSRLSALALDAAPPAAGGGERCAASIGGECGSGGSSGSSGGEGSGFLPTWDAAAASHLGGSTECLWAATEVTRSLKAIPLPVSTSLRLVSCAVVGVGGVLDAPFHFFAAISSAPYQGCATEVFWDSRAASKETSVVRGGGCEAFSPGVPLAGASGGGALGLGGMLGSTGSGGGREGPASGSSSGATATSGVVYAPKSAFFKGDILLTFRLGFDVEGKGSTAVGPVEVFRAAFHCALPPQEPPFFTHLRVHTRCNAIGARLFLFPPLPLTHSKSFPFTPSLLHSCVPLSRA